MSDWLPILLLPVLIGAFRPHLPGPRWGGRDLLLALGVGAMVAVAAGTWFSRYYIQGSPFLQSDFSQYCEGVDTARHGLSQTDAPHRSHLVALLLAPLANALGVRDALIAGALISTGFTAIGLYLWGFAVGGRMAGLASAAGLLVVSPLALLSRTITFYPELAAALAWMAGTTAMAVRTRHAAWFGIASFFVALSPLIDLKALPWMIPPAVALVGVALWAPPGDWRAARALGRLAILLGFLGASWGVGPKIWPPEMGGSLESQMASYVGDVERRAGVNLGIGQRAGYPRLCGTQMQTAFRWGTGSPLAIPGTLQCLRTMRALIPAEMLSTPVLERERRTQVEPWFPVLAGTAGVVLVGLGIDAARRRRLSRLAALLIPMPPFAYALMAAANEDPDTRRLSTSMLFLPVLLGVAWTLLFRWRSALGPPGGSNRLRLVATVAACLALTLLLTGVIPSWISPAASWRTAVTEDWSWQDALDGILPRSNADVACSKAHAEDLSAGHPVDSRFRGPYRFPTREYRPPRP